MKLFILLALSFPAFAATQPYCLQISAARLLPRIQKVSIHPNSARGEEKKLLSAEIANKFHDDLAAIVSSWRARDKAPAGKRLGTMTYYPEPIKKDPALIERFVATLPASQRNYYRETLAEFSERNRVRMREYVIADENIDPYKMTDVNRGFTQSDVMVFNDAAGKASRFFNVEWKIKIESHHGVDISSRNANIKPSLPVVNDTFKNFIEGKISDQVFAEKSLNFYAHMRDAKRQAGKPLKDDWENQLAKDFYLKIAAYFRAVKYEHGDKFVDSRVTYTRVANEYQFSFDKNSISTLTESRKTALKNALTTIYDKKVSQDDEQLFKQVVETLQLYAGGSLGVWKDGQLTTTMQMTRDPMVFFERVGNSLMQPNWRGVYDASSTAGSVPRGLVFTEAKISLPWLVLLEKSKSNSSLKVVLDIFAEPILKADRLWEKLNIHQDPNFDSNKGKIAFYEQDVSGAGSTDPLK